MRIHIEPSPAPKVFSEAAATWIRVPRDAAEVCDERRQPLTAAQAPVLATYYPPTLLLTCTQKFTNLLLTD
jgi:hypothetical protein